MTFEQFLESVGNRDLSLLVVNHDASRQFQSMLEELFDDDPVSVRERHVPGKDADAVYLTDGEEIVASSSLASLKESILLVNSDLYMTGTRDTAMIDLPDVITGLEDVQFRLRGYPESDNEKLLLITISRYIEQLALESEGGTHRAGFQRLSRLNVERGTRWVYEQLADSTVDTHVYGIPDWTPPSDFGITIHGGWSDEFRDTWFVTFVPEADGGTYAALVAIERSPRVWDGFWTYDPQLVGKISRYIETEL